MRLNYSKNKYFLYFSLKPFDRASFIIVKLTYLSKSDYFIKSRSGAYILMDDEDKLTAEEALEKREVDDEKEATAETSEEGSSEEVEESESGPEIIIDSSYPSDRDSFLLSLLYFEDVVTTLEKLEELYSVSNIETERAFEALKIGNYLVAEEHLTKALELDEKNQNALIYTAIMHLKLNNDEEASSYCDLARKNSPDNPNSWICTAAVFIKGQEYDEALKNLDKALELSPKNIELLINKASCLIRLGYFDEAIRVTYRAQKISHSNVHAWINKGIAYAYTFRVKDAINCFNEALMLDPSNAVAQHAKEEMRRRLTQ